MSGRVRVSFTAAVVVAGALSGAGPAGAAGPACGDVVTTDTTLTADLTCSGDGLVVAAPGVTLDLAGRTISGPGSRSGPTTGGPRSPPVSRSGTARSAISGRP